MTVEGAMDSFQKENLVFRPLSPALELSSVLVWKKFQPFQGRLDVSWKNSDICSKSMRAHKR